jgi:hypothetical protein
MIALLLFITLISSVCAFEPSCSSCKHFIPNNRGDFDLGLCKMFRTSCYHKGTQYTLPNYAVHCRENEKLCGKSGFLYEMNEVIYDKNLLEQDIQNELIELNNRCCGEVNETDEIEQLEKEFFELFQKMKKHNKKRIYKTTQDLYKLFKK